MGAQSPTLVRQADGWWLHLPFEQRVAIAGRAKERRKAEPGPGTIELNAASSTVAAWEGPLYSRW